MEKAINVLIEPKKMNKQAGAYSVVILLVSLAMFFSIWGIQWGIKMDDLLIISLLGLGGILIHEVIHVVAFIVIGKAKISDVKFGVIWKHITPYAHCKIPLSIKAYKISILLPVIITGFIPMFISLISGNLLLVLVFTFLITGGIGDWLMYLKLRPFPSDAKVQDHPTEIGCIVKLNSVDVAS